MRGDQTSVPSVRPVILGATSASCNNGKAVIPMTESVFSQAIMGLRPTPGSPIAIRENLSQRAYLRIRSSLIHSELRPGQRLVLRPLAAELRLSPTPVREALLRLVTEQALALDDRGTVIVPVIGLEEFREIVQILCDLEGRAAARAALLASPMEVEQIAVLVRVFYAATAIGDRVATLGSNAELHRIVCHAARAPLILRILEGIWMRIGPVYALNSEESASVEIEGVHPHDKLIEALRNHDSEAARDAVILDVRRSTHWLEHSLILASRQLVEVLS
jgi:DNA-binding GntR family transcriptional regulator